MNPLHGACEAGRAETVRALMEFVAADEEKKTALTMAKNGDEKTAWAVAEGTKNQAVCQVLKDCGDTNGASSGECKEAATALMMMMMMMMMMIMMLYWPTHQFPCTIRIFLPLRYNTTSSRSSLYSH